MTYQEAVEYLESLIDYERTPAGVAAARVWNLDRTRHLLQAAGDPHRGKRFLHIAGTKGKGSTAAMTASILTAAGYHTGLYTSPHLVSFRERIQVGGKMIAEEEVASLVKEARPVIETMRGGAIGLPSFFEAYTLLALKYFAQQGVDVAILETGLGGRLDATNVVQPFACGITRIGMDHLTELGASLQHIAREKAGIIKAGIPVVSAPQETDAREVLTAVCAERGAELFVVNDTGPRVREVRVINEHIQELAIEGLAGERYDLSCPLLGSHQAENAAIAIGLAELAGRAGIPVGKEAVVTGLAHVRWPGRFQVVSQRPTVVLDGAHDEVGAVALARAMGTIYPGRRVLLLLGVGRDKDADAIARALCPSAEAVIATASASPRALPAEELHAVCFRWSKHVSAFTPMSLAIREALNRVRVEDVLLITGSLYVVGEAMKALGITLDDFQDSREEDNG